MRQAQRQGQAEAQLEARGRVRGEILGDARRQQHAGSGQGQRPRRRVRSAPPPDVQQDAADPATPQQQPGHAVQHEQAQVAAVRVAHALGLMRIARRQATLHHIGGGGVVGALADTGQRVLLDDRRGGLPDVGAAVAAGEGVFETLGIHAAE